MVSTANGVGYRSCHHQPGGDVRRGEPTGASEDNPVVLAFDETEPDQLVDLVRRADAGTGARPQREGEQLFGAPVGRKLLAARFRRDTVADRGDIAVGRAHVPPAPARGVAVRRASDPEILATVPIQLVVAA